MGFLAGLIGGGDGAQQPAMAQPVDPLAPLPEQQATRPHKAFRDTGFANVLGMLGDALLVRGGHAPMYAPMKAQRQEQQRQDQANQAIGNYLGNLDPALRDLITQAGPGAGMKAYELAHPQAKDPPSFVREYEYREGLDPEHRKSFDGYAEQRKFNPYASPITLGPGDTYEPGGSDAPQTATNPETGEKVQYNPQSGQWEPVGGPTAGPSGGFSQ